MIAPINFSDIDGTRLTIQEGSVEDSVRIFLSGDKFPTTKHHVTGSILTPSLLLSKNQAQMLVLALLEMIDSPEL